MAQQALIALGPDQSHFLQLPDGTTYMNGLPQGMVEFLSDDQNTAMDTTCVSIGVEGVYAAVKVDRKTSIAYPRKFTAISLRPEPLIIGIYRQQGLASRLDHILG